MLAKMGGGEDDDDHAPQVDFDAGDESTDDESDAGDGDVAAVTVSAAAAAAAATGADGQPNSTAPFDATDLNLNQAILKGLDVVRQHSGSGGGANGGLNSAEASTAAATDAATANTPPSSVASVAGDPTTGGGAGVSAAVERGVESARESNEGSAAAAAAKSHLDMDGSRRMIKAALGGGGGDGNYNNNNKSRSTSRAARPVPPPDHAAKPAAVVAARGYADVAGPSKSSSGELANGDGGNGGSYNSRALPPDPYKLGVYVPPHQRKRMVEERRKAMEEMEREEKKDDADDKVSGNDMDGEEEGEEREEDHADDHSGGLLQPTPANMATQRQSWEELRKLINGTINRLNATTIKPLIHKLFDEGNLIRGRGLLAKTVLRAATTSPSYADVYAALVAVINTKLPEVGELVLTRTILQFQKSYKRRDKAQAVATANFLGQLFNQGMTHELLCLQLLTILLDGDPTDDSVEVAVSYMRVVGKALLEVSPAGVRAVMERFRGLLHDGSIGKRVQYKVEVLMKDRQRHFEDFPSVVPELDLVEADDQIMFELGLDDEDLKKDEVLDVFRFDPSFVQNEATWAKIRREILGEDSDSSSDDSGDSDTDSSSDSDDDGDSDAEEDQEMAPAVSSSADKKKTQVIHDLTESDLVHLRRTIYLTIMSSATFEECTHKLTKVDIPLGRESELINMIIECCSQERTFLRYYGMIAARFCLLHPRWCNAFMEAFGVQYETIHRLETNKLRNVAKLFAHLLHTDSMPWSVLTVIHLNEDETTSSSRIFVKILVQEMAEAMGMAKLRDRFETTDPEHSQWYAGMFPRDVPRNTRYAINFFTSIGLGPLTDGLREHLKNAPKLILAQAQAEAAAKAAAEAERGDDSSVSSSSSSSTSSGSSSSFSSSSYSSSSSSSYSSDSRSRGRRRGRNRGRNSRRKGGRSRRRRSYSSSSSSSSSSRSSYSSRSSSVSSRFPGKRRDDKRRSRSRSRSGSRSRSRSTSVRRGRTDRRKAGSRSRSRSPERNSKRQRDRSRSRSISRSRSPPRRGGKRRRSYSSSRSRSRSPKGRRHDEKRDRSRSRSALSGRDSRSATSRNRSNSRGRESRDTKRRRRSSRSRSGSRSRSRSLPRRRRRSRSRS